MDIFQAPRVCPPDFKPDFAKGQGLVAAIVQDFASKEVLMLAFMNEEAWQATLATKEAHYYSRSRKSLWHKGESSGHVQKVHAILIDCDNDAVLLQVEQVGGAACHTGHRSCFYRALGAEGITQACPCIVSPEQMYGKK